MSVSGNSTRTIPLVNNASLAASANRPGGAVRVLVASARAELAAALSAAFDHGHGNAVLESALDAKAAAARCVEWRPEVALLDLDFPPNGGIDAARRLTAARPDLCVVFLAQDADRSTILRALDDGASGFLSNDITPDELVRAVDRVLQGELALSPRAALFVNDDRRAYRVAALLSERERDVLALIGGGLPNKLVARELGVGEAASPAALARIVNLVVGGAGAFVLGLVVPVGWTCCSTPAQSYETAS